MTILQMQYFREAALAGSTQKAAERLHASQSAVSQSIKTMEGELGVTVFDRSSKGLVLNKAGECLLEHVNSVFKEVDLLQESMKQYTKQVHPICLGMPPMLCYLYWSDLYLRLTREFPGMEFRVIIKTAPMILGMLKDVALDGAILGLDDDMFQAPLKVRLLKKEPNMFVTFSRKHRLADRAMVSFQDLLEEPVIGYENSTLLEQIIQDGYSAYGAKLKFSIRCETLSLLLQFLRKNAGIAYLGRRVPDSDTELISLPVIELPGNNTNFVWNEKRVSDIPAEKLARCIEAYFREEVK